MEDREWKAEFEGIRTPGCGEGPLYTTALDPSIPQGLDCVALPEIHRMNSTRLYIGLLGRYLRPQWRRMLALTVLLLTSIGLQLVSPQFIRRFIDIAQEQGSLGALYAAATTFLLLGVVTQVVALVAKYIGANVGWLATNRLRSELTLHLLRLDMPFHNERTPGQLIERVDSDITRLANFFSFFIVRLVGGLLLTSGVLVVLFFEDYRLGLVLTAFVVVYLVVHFMGQRLAVPFVKAEREASADYYGFLSESFQAVKDIQTGGASEHMTRRFHSFVRPLFATQWKMDFVFSTSWAVSNTVAALGFTAALGVGAYLFQNGAITVGTVYLVIHYLNIIQFPLVQISREVQDLQRAQVSIGRVRELLEIQPGIKDDSLVKTRFEEVPAI